MTQEQTHSRTSLAELATSGPVVIDGGMGTLLQDTGLDDGGSGELTMKLRKRLTDLQRGAIQDTHGWMHRLG